MAAARTTPGKLDERPPVRAYVIDQERCINCWWCRRDCPTDTIHFFDRVERKHWIDPTGCIDCGICEQVCPMHTIRRDEAYVHEDGATLEAAKEKARAWARAKREQRERRRRATPDDNPMVTFLKKLQEMDINPADAAI
jgi:ferredoxin